jgi:hypothetical protein
MKGIVGLEKLVELPQKLSQGWHLKRHSTMRSQPILASTETNQQLKSIGNW